MPDSADALQTTYLATLLADLARLVGEVEQLAVGARRGVPDDAAAIAEQQAAIVAAAHEEAASILAAAHTAAACVLDAAGRGQRVARAEPLVDSVVTSSVLDLRDAVADAAADDDMRASIAAAMDMARGLSQSIQRLSQELGESPDA